MLKYVMCGILCFASLIGGEDQKVCERLQNLSKAVNEDNVQQLPTFWTADAVFSNPETGEDLKGAEFLQFLQERAKEIKDRKLQFAFKVGKIDFPQKDQAVVTGIAEVTNNGALLKRNARRLELVSINGVWYVKAVREIEVPPAPPLYEHLKELEWMLGNWKDTDQDVDITFSTKWDKFKNFLVQHFTMAVYGLEAMEGMQIIGWDPVEKKIRSWIYDSDGGVGTGLWTKNGDSWSAQMNFVLSDGEKGSATNIYTKVNDKSYKFSSVDRSIEGEEVPDIEPVTIVKGE